MSQLSKIKRNTNPDMVYYDMIATNFQTTTTSNPNLRFIETRTNPIIQNTGEYYMSIIRFSLDTYDLPNFVCEIQPNQSDPDLSIYSITLEYDDGAGNLYPVQTYIQWVPQNKSSAVPNAPDTTTSGYQQSNTDYYYCYHFQYFIDLINDTFATCMADLITATGGAGVSPIENAHQPIISWDVMEQKAIISAENDYYNDDLTAKINIYFNPAMYSLFNSFMVENYGYSASDGKNFRLVIEDYEGSNLGQFPVNDPTYDVVQVIQEFSTIDTWTPISSIVFTSNTLPIISNQLSAPLIYANNEIIQTSNNANFSQIITDFETNQQCYKPQIEYNSQSEYRRIDMTGNTPLYNIDIEVFWRDKLGVFHPLTLPTGASCTIKFLFEKKDKLGLKNENFV